MHQMQWMDEDGEVRSQAFHTEDEARQAAATVAGVVLLFPMGGGTPSVFRDGQELHDTDATEASLKFGHRMEVGISRPEEPDTDIDPGDTTGSGWRPGFPAQWGWRVWRGSAGPTEWVGTHHSRKDARAAAEQAQKDDPDLAGLHIVDIGPTDIP